MTRAIYLDHMATTPMDSQVLTAMLPYFSEHFGNPLSLHSYGREAAVAVEKARREIADTLQTEAEQLFFTSGATESNNMAIMGLAAKLPMNKRHVLTLATEHASVLEPYKRLKKQGFEVTFLKPLPSGLVDLTVFEQALTAQTGLVSLSWVNSEIGVIQPIQALSQRIKQQGAFLHVDAVQAMGKIPVTLNAFPVDAMVFSGHKIYGPKGVGFTYLAKNHIKNLDPLILGGKQEQGLRAGTLAVPLIIGLAKACMLAKQRQAEDHAHALMLRDTFLQGLAVLNNWQVNGDLTERIPHNLNIAFTGIAHETLRLALPMLAFSAGSACAAGKIEPSHVLQALDLPRRHCLSSVRFSFGRMNTLSEINEAAAHLIKAIAVLKTDSF